MRVLLPGMLLGTALLLGVRNALYAARINALLRPTGWRRFVMAEVTIDESTAMAVSESRSGYSGRAFCFTALSVYVLWNVSTVVGALVGGLLLGILGIHAEGLIGTIIVAIIGAVFLIWLSRRLKKG